ncbi:MAG: hypothetical protein ACYC7J_04340 [Syntrophales bacterium]
MNPWTALSAIIGILALMFAVFIQLNSSIDKKIEEKLKNPEFIQMIAREVRLPFVVFDENNSIIVDSGAMDYIEKIEIKKEDRQEVSEIIISPKKYLAVPPILENLDAYMAFEMPTRGNRFDLIYKKAETEEVKWGDGRPIDKRPKKKFRLQIIILPGK